MEEKLRTLYELCETIERELTDAVEKIRQSGGKLSAGDVDYIDKLTHSMKSIKTTIAMMEAEDEGGYSENYSNRSYRGNSYRGGSYRGSYRDGGYATRRRRDSMGRYSSEGGYTNADNIDGLLDEMRGMMDQLPEEKRREVQRFVEKMDRM